MGCSESNVATGTASPMKVQNQRQPKSSSANLISGAEYDSVVIGGGIGGIAAAVKLAKKGQKVALLEANDYLGGRLKTQQIQLSSGDTIQFDLGASWIHQSCKQHPITQLSKKVEGLVMQQTDSQQTQCFDEKGLSVDKQVDQMQKTFHELTQKCKKWQPKYSMEEAFKKLKNGIVNDKYFMYHVSNDTQFQSSGSIRDLAACAFDDDQFDGKEMLILSGYQRFAETLAQQEQFQVFLGQKVKKVISSNEKSEIVCQSGTSIYANNVIIAVPIGVLKANSIQFQPPLPTWKQQAIKSIGFGNVCKVLVDYPDKKLFDIKSDWIGVVSDNVNERGLITTFVNVQKLANVSAMMTFGIGENADQVEKMPEGELKKIVAKRLSAFSQENISPQDFKIYRSSWRGNQNFLGTYSYASTKTVRTHWQNLAKPVFNSNWYFCGEHTSFRYRGSVHGAYLSGVNAAGFITSKMSEGNWKYPDFEEDNKSQSESSHD